MSDVLYTHNLEWKEFSIDLGAVKTWMDSNTTDCCGLSADANLRAHFTSVPTDEVKTAIDGYWSGLNTGSSEVVGYKSNAEIQAAIAALKEGMLSKDWNAMSATERKLMLNLPVTKEDLF
jgi:hypothetical protein